MVEADGEWHTSDNKFASSGWRATHTVKKPPPARIRTRSPSPVKAVAPPTTSGPEILILDSDEEDEGRVKRELSPRYGTGTFSAQSSFGTLPPASQVGEPIGNGGVIDLTGESDEDESPTPPRRPSAPLVPLAIPQRPEKRKAVEEISPSEAVWKKSRADSGHTNGGGSSTSGTASPHGLPSASTVVYPSSLSPYSARRSPSADDRYAHDRYSRYRSPPHPSGTGYYSGSGSRTASTAYRGYTHPSSGRTDTSSGARWT